MTGWEHLGNTHAHAEWFRCSSCGRERSLSNMSEQYHEHREPEPCDCSGGGST